MNDTAKPTSTNAPKLAVWIRLDEGEQILHPVADHKEALALLDKIMKTPGFILLARDSDAPAIFHVRHVIKAQVVLMPTPVTGGQIARVQ